MTRDLPPGRPRLYEFPSSPHCLKVRAIAHELGVRLERTTVNVFRGEMETPALRALNPNCLVPVLVDGDFVLWESNAILTYLATIHPSPSLLPADPRERAGVDRWLHWQSAHLGPAIARVAFERFVKPMTGRGAPDEALVASAREDFTRHCAALDVSLAGADYVARRLSVADFAIACVLATSTMVGLDLRASPRVEAWLGRMLARDSLERALAEAQQSLRKIVPPPR